MHRKPGREGLLSNIRGTLEIRAFPTGTLERRIVLKYDVAALLTLVPVSTSNS
jgi:hypothetical protein